MSIGVVVTKYSASSAVWHSYVSVVLRINPGEEKIFYINEKILHLIDLQALDTSCRTVSYKNFFSLMFSIFSEKLISHIVTANYIETILCSLVRLFRIKLIQWVQGTIADESFYFRNRSRFRWLIISLLEFCALNIASSRIYVSEAMKIFFEEKFHFIPRSPCQISPCLSKLRYDGCAKVKNSFIYIGGLSAWQEIDKIIDFFEVIYSQDSTASLTILTLDVPAAKKKIQHRKISPVCTVVASRDRSEIEKILSRHEYGFLFRRRSPVNLVASPIKFLEYIACNVKPIMTDCIGDYSNLVKKEKLGYLVSMHDLEFEWSDIVDAHSVRCDLHVYYEENFYEEKYIVKVK